MIVRINGVTLQEVDPKIPQVSKPVVVSQSWFSKNKKILKYSAMALMPILLSCASHAFADFTFEVPDSVREQIKHMKPEATMNPTEAITKKYKKSFWYRHSGVVTRVIVDKKHGETFEQHWEAFGYKCFEIFKSVVFGFLKGMGKFIVVNNDLFFLLPAIGTLLMTFLIGKNKYTKFTLPLFLAYFVSSVFRGFLL